MTSDIGILAGAGRYPLALLREGRRRGAPLPAVALKRVSVDAISDAASATEWLAVGQLAKAARFLRQQGARAVIMAGGIPWNPIAVRPRLDRRALRLIPKVWSGDDQLLRAVAESFEGLGLEVVGPGDLAAPLLVAEGRLGGPALTPQGRREAVVAWVAAKSHGRRDRGQAAAAVGGGTVLLEGRGGTNALFRRAGRPLWGRRRTGGVLAKVMKPGQDRRFDLPAIGPRTVTEAARFGFSAVVVEAGATLVIDKEETASLADALGVTVVAWVDPHPGR